MNNDSNIKGFCLTVVIPLKRNVLHFYEVLVNRKSHINGPCIPPIKSHKRSVEPITGQGFNRPSKYRNVFLSLSYSLLPVSKE